MSSLISKNKRDELILNGRALRKYMKGVIFSKWSKETLKKLLKEKINNSQKKTEESYKEKECKIATGAATQRNKYVSQRNQKKNDLRRTQKTIEKNELSSPEEEEEKYQERKVSYRRRTGNIRFSEQRQRQKRVKELRDSSTSSRELQYETKFTETEKEKIDIQTQTPVPLVSQSTQVESNDIRSPESEENDIPKPFISEIKKNKKTKFVEKEEETTPKSVLPADPDMLFVESSSEESEEEFINVKPELIPSRPVLPDSEKQNSYSVIEDSSSRNDDVVEEYLDVFIDNNEDENNSEEEMSWNLLKNKPTHKTTTKRTLPKEEMFEYSDDDKQPIKEEQKADESHETGLKIESPKRGVVSIEPNKTAQLSPSNSLTQSPQTVKRLPIVMVRRSPIGSPSELEGRVDIEEISTSGDFEFEDQKQKKTSPPSSLVSTFSKLPADSERHDSEIPIEIMTDSSSDIDIDDLVNHQQEEEEKTPPESPLKDDDHEQTFSLSDTQLIDLPLGDLISGAPVAPPKPDSELREFMRQFFTPEFFSECQLMRSTGGDVPFVEIPDTVRRPYSYSPDYIDLIVDLLNEMVMTVDITGMFYEHFLDIVEEQLGVAPVEKDTVYVQELYANAEEECDNAEINILLDVADSLLASHTMYILGMKY